MQPDLYNKFIQYTLIGNYYFKVRLSSYISYKLFDFRRVLWQVKL